MQTRTRWQGEFLAAVRRLLPSDSWQRSILPANAIVSMHAEPHLVQVASRFQFGPRYADFQVTGGSQKEHWDGPQPRCRKGLEPEVLTAGLSTGLKARRRTEGSKYGVRGGCQFELAPPFQALASASPSCVRSLFASFKPDLLFCRSDVSQGPLTSDPLLIPSLDAALSVQHCCHTLLPGISLRRTCHTHFSRPSVP